MSLECETKGKAEACKARKKLVCGSELEGDRQREIERDNQKRQGRKKGRKYITVSQREKERETETETGRVIET